MDADPLDAAARTSGGEVMPCPICDQKPANCDCTAKERRQYGEIEDLEYEVERLRAENAKLRALAGIPKGMAIPDCMS